MHKSEFWLVEKAAHEVVCHVGGWPKTRTRFPAPLYEVPMLVFNYIWPRLHRARMLHAVIFNILDVKSGLTPGTASGDNFQEDRAKGIHVTPNIGLDWVNL